LVPGYENHAVVAIKTDSTSAVFKANGKHK